MESSRKDRMFMNRVFFIADPHFGDERIRRYENRPLLNVEEMDSRMICNWNAVVTDSDIVYVLGDFGANDREAEVLSKLNGRKLLVKGNHDEKSNAEYRAAGFEEVYDKPILFEGFWLLSHDALYVNSNMPYANIFGHVHNSPLIRDYSKQHFCVSVERIDYTPIRFELIKKTVAEAE